MPSKPTVPFSPPAQVVQQQRQPPMFQPPQQPLPPQPTQPTPEEQAAFVHPAVAASPEAMAYALGAQQRLQLKKNPGGPPLQKYTAERPGDAPPMPPLEAQHHEGMTMEQQAAMYGDKPEQVAAQAVGGNSIVEQQPQFSLGSMDSSAPQKPPTPQQMGIMPTDMLPEEAMQDPHAQRGGGDRYAVNQPGLAMKYGVIRGGMHVPPQALQANVGGGPQARPGSRPLQQTIQDLQSVASAQPPQGVARTEQEAEQQAAQAAAHSSQNVGKVPEPKSTKDDEELSPEEKKRVDEAVAKLDDFDYDNLRKQMNRNELNNPEQREIIEERLEPLDLTELITRDRVSQDIPIIPGKFWVKFTSMTGDDDLELKKLLMKESTSVEVSERYLLDKFALMTLTAGCMFINGNPCPSHTDEKGDFNEDRFWLKFAWMLKRGIHVLASIGANHTWFELRVRKLLVAERVKNG